MAEDLRVGEELIAVDVIAVVVSIQQPSEVFASSLLRCGDESFGRNGALRGIDRQQVVLSNNHSRV